MKKYIALLAMAFIFVSGCSLSKKAPMTSETAKVYTYEQPVDLVYLKTLEALDADNNWVFQYTNKEAGIVEIRNLNYQNLFDADRQVARFLIKRVDTTHTSIEVDVSNSKCWGDVCQKALEFIDTMISALPPRQNSNVKSVAPEVQVVQEAPKAEIAEVPASVAESKPEVPALSPPAEQVMNQAPASLDQPVQQPEAPASDAAPEEVREPEAVVQAQPAT